MGDFTVFFGRTVSPVQIIVSSFRLCEIKFHAQLQTNVDEILTQKLFAFAVMVRS